MWTPVILYFDCEIMFPSPILTKADDGAVHGASTSWLDHASEQVGAASLHHLEQLSAADKNRELERRKNQYFITP